MHEEVYLSFAAFVYILKETGIEYIDENNFIILWFGHGMHHFCSINRKKNNSDCGYIAISSDDYESLFRNYTHLVDPNLSKPEANDFYRFRCCERPKIRQSDGNIEHCTADISIRSKIDFRRNNGEQVKCLILNTPQDSTAVIEE